MESKKSNEADIEQIRSSLFMGGLIFVSGIVLAAFTFQTVNGGNKLDNLNEKTANNVYTQEEKQEETPPPAATPQVNVPPPVTENIIKEENKKKERNKIKIRQNDKPIFILLNFFRLLSIDT